VIKNTISNILSTIWNAITATLRKIVNTLSNILNTIWNAITTTLRTVRDTISNVLNKVRHAITTMVRTIWNAITSTVRTIWNAITTTVKTIWNTTLNVLRAIVNPIVNTLRAAWDSITRLVRTISNAIIDTVRTIWNVVTTSVRRAWTTITNTVRSIWNAVTTFLDRVVNLITSGVRAVWNFVTGIVRACWNPVINAVRFCWNIFTNTVNTIWNAVTFAVRSVWNFITGTIRAVWNAISGTYRYVRDAIKCAVTTVWNALTGTLRVIWNAVTSLANRVINTITSRMKAVWNFFSGIVGAVWNKISGVARTIWRFVTETAITAWNRLTDCINTAWNGVKSRLRICWQKIQAIMRAVWTAVTFPFRTLWNGLTWAAKTIYNGMARLVTFIKGVIIKPIWNAVVSTVARFRDYLVSALRKIGQGINFFITKIGDGAVMLKNGFISLMLRLHLDVLWNRAIYPVLRFVARVLHWNMRITYRILRFTWWFLVKSYSVLKSLIQALNWKKGIRSNYFTLDIRPGELVRSTAYGPLYVMKDGQHYGVYLRNDSAVPCLCELSIDGEKMGTYKLQPHSAYTIKRPVHENRCFTFLKATASALGIADYMNAPETAVRAWLNSTNTGLVEAKFIPHVNIAHIQAETGRSKRRQALPRIARLDACLRTETMRALAPCASSSGSSLPDMDDYDNPEDAKRAAESRHTEDLESDENDDLAPEEEQFVAGKTALTGTSNQEVQATGGIQVRNDLAVTIKVRLVGRADASEVEQAARAKEDAPVIFSVPKTPVIPEDEHPTTSTGPSSSRLRFFRIKAS